MLLLVTDLRIAGFGRPWIDLVHSRAALQRVFASIAGQSDRYLISPAAELKSSKASLDDWKNQSMSVLPVSLSATDESFWNGPSCAASVPPSGKSVGGWFTASSRHDGGCHVLMGDGTVRFVNENIDTGNLKGTRPGESHTSDRAYFGADASSYGIWGHLGSIAAGETVSY